MHRVTEAVQSVAAGGSAPPACSRHPVVPAAKALVIESQWVSNLWPYPVNCDHDDPTIGRFDSPAAGSSSGPGQQPRGLPRRAGAPLSPHAASQLHTRHGNPPPRRRYPKDDSPPAARQPAPTPRRRRAVSLRWLTKWVILLRVRRWLDPELGPRARPPTIVAAFLSLDPPATATAY
jgi:hypothetical protein